MSKTTTITLKQKTRDRLQKLGVKGETFDEVVCNLLTESGFVNQIEPLLQKVKDVYVAYTRDYASPSVHTDMIASMPAFLRCVERFIETVKNR